MKGKNLTLIQSRRKRIIKKELFKCFLLLILFFSSNGLSAPGVLFKERAKPENKDLFLLDSIINSLKQKEGLRLNVYTCPGGHKTIGYGHLITQNDNYTVITELTAETLLKQDFQKAFNSTDSSLAYNKRLALGHFIFNLGIDSYSGSILERLVKGNQDINKEIIKWCYYTKDGVKVRSKALFESRKFELKIYNYGKQ